MNQTFTILKQDQRGINAIFDVLADGPAGFEDFADTYGHRALPGSTVDIADFRTVLRLRNDGTWEEYRSYATEAEAAEIEAKADAAAEAILDDLLPEDESEVA